MTRRPLPTLARWALRGALLGLSLLPVFGIELLLETGVLDPTGSHARRAEERSDERLRVLARERQHGVDAWTSVHPYYFVTTDGLPDGRDALFPLGGISEVETIYCNEADAWVRFSADEHGFNNPSGLHRAGEVDVVVIGDSYAQGRCVRTAEGPAGRLRAFGLRALSLGSDASGPLVELATLSEYGLPLRPRHVVWLYYEGNDLHDFAREQQSQVLARYREDAEFSQRLASRQREIRRRLKAWLRTQEASYQSTETLRPRRLLALRGVRGLLGLTRPAPAPDDAFESLLAEAARRARGVGASFLFVYLPHVDRYETGRADDGSFFQRDAVLRRVRSAEIDVLDFSAKVAAAPEPAGLYSLRAGRHFDAEGYALLGAEIAARLRASR